MDAAANDSASSKPGPSLKGRALRLLAGRDYGRIELERKLAPHADSAEQMAQVLDDLQAKGFISDERAAASHLHRRADQLGQARLLQETEENRLKTVWQKKFAQAPQDAAEKAKQMRFLASRGFAPGLISKWMRSLGAGAADEE